VLLLSLCLSVLARAGETDDAVGRMHFDAGERLFHGGRYKEAPAEFTAGYELTKRPAFLLNIAQCYRELGERARAREFYKTYLLLDPNSPLIPGVRKLIDELDEPSEPPPPGASPAPPPAAVTPPPIAAAVMRPAPHRSRHVASALLFGLAGASLISAAALTGASHVEYDRLVSRCAPPRGAGCSEDQIGLPVREQWASVGLYTAAGGLAAAGLITVLLEVRAAR